MSLSRIARLAVRIRKQRNQEGHDARRKRSVHRALSVLCKLSADSEITFQTLSSLPSSHAVLLIAQTWIIRIVTVGNVGTG
jgi:hypothetical protein